MQWINDETIMISLSGELTAAAEPAIEQGYQQASDRGVKNIIVNLAENNYITSAGIAVLIGLMAEVRQREQRLLIAIAPHHRKVFQMVGLTRYAAVDSLDEILRQVQQ
jgi:anti-anti-sigma factor